MTAYVSHSSDETVHFGMLLARSLHNGDIIALSGDLGTGKTHFVAGVCRGLGVQGHVSSPTFTIINEYPTGDSAVVHIDLYRITSQAELSELGIEEYFNERYICLIEWAERMVADLPPSAIRVELTYGGEDNERLVTLNRILDGAPVHRGRVR